jgi:hypothetical protein
LLNPNIRGLNFYKYNPKIRICYYKYNKPYQKDRRRRNAARNKILGYAAAIFSIIRTKGRASTGDIETDIEAIYQPINIPMSINPQPLDQQSQPSQVATSVDTKYTK